MRAIFCGNFEYDARQSEVERLFRRYGKVDRVDMKSGFAFVYMEDERDAEDAIRALDRTDFGRKGRRLRVEWTKQERGGGGGGGSGGSRRSGGGSRRSSSNLRPSKTLFVINFDPQLTRTRDLERHFEPYGKIASVRIRRNFAFVQYEEQEDATKALDATDSSKLMDRVISVEYAVRDDDERRDGDRDRHRSPERRRRSPSPYRRERGSPDYGRGERGSPDYGRGSSPAPNRRVRGSPRYAHGSSRSPVRRERSESDVRRERSRSPYGGRRKLSPANGRGRSQSPYEEEVRFGHGRGRDRSMSPYDKETSRRGNGDAKAYSPENGRGSPREDGALSPANGRDRSVSPAPED